MRVLFFPFVWGMVPAVAIGEGLVSISASASCDLNFKGNYAETSRQ